MKMNSKYLELLRGLISELMLGVTLLGVFGCSTSAINIQSTPVGADVYISPVGKAQPKLLGRTPYVSSGAQLSRENGGSGPVMLELKKVGYLPARTLVTEMESVDVSMSLELQATTGLEDQEKLNQLMDQIFEGQHLARTGGYDQALLTLKAVEKQAPQLAAVYEIEGGVYYLQKKYKDALGAYSLAVKYNPKNIESLRMRAILEDSLKITSGPVILPPPPPPPPPPQGGKLTQ